MNNDWKFVKMKKFIDEINDLEKTRTDLKKQLREQLSNPLLSINAIIEYAVYHQRALKKLSANIQELHHIYNNHWFGLNDEDKVRYRYWSNGLPFPNDVADQKEKPEIPSDRPENQNVPVSEKKVARSYFKIDRANAQKLCSKLIDFLSGKDEYFKVGFDETHSS